MLSTGEQVLDSLSWKNQNVGHSIFGLCMMIIGLLVMGVVCLHFNQLRYLDLGHVGVKKAALTPKVPEAEDNVTAAAAALALKGGAVGEAAAPAAATSRTAAEASNATGENEAQIS